MYDSETGVWTCPDCGAVSQVIGTLPSYDDDEVLEFRCDNKHLWAA